MCNSIIMLHIIILPGNPQQITWMIHLLLSAHSIFFHEMHK
jgi:hypothetical protein